MNIFWLDSDLEKCAHAYCDQHVVKMITEYAQLLSASSRISGLAQGYKLSHTKHPCTLWLLESETNWKVLKLLAHYVHNEYISRFGNVHKAYLTIKTLETPKLPKIKMTRPPLCMPEYCKGGSVIDSYRKYYIKEKYKFARWRYCEKPDWYIKGLEDLNSNKILY